MGHSLEFITLCHWERRAWETGQNILGTDAHSLIQFMEFKFDP